MTLLWEDVAAEFEFEGSWRDVWVPDATIPDWLAAAASIRSSRSISCTIDGAPAAFPADPPQWSLPESRKVAQLNIGGPVLNCHFFAPAEIEFDLDPREFTCQRHLDALLGFMRLLAQACQREVLLTPENLHDVPIVVVGADGPPRYLPVMKELAPRAPDTR